MIVIGLCGGSGSGKSTVAHLFEKYDIPSVNTDDIYKEITSYNSDCMKELVNAFGSGISFNDGSLNRSVMRELVFASADSEKKRTMLNEITHKFVRQEVVDTIKRYESAEKKAITLDVPLMFESGFNTLCTYVIAVVADTDVRLKRIAYRDNIAESYAIARIKSQMPEQEIINKSDFVLVNNSNINNLDNNIREIIHNLNLFVD